jgi:hypothetical protein
MRIGKLQHRFVKAIPEKLEDGVLYISPDYRTITHKCCCGCGFEVVTPLGPTDWKLTFDGVSVSLFPSIGNWSLACRSHYWVEKGNVHWAGQWTDRQIAQGRRADQISKDALYGDNPSTTKSPGHRTTRWAWIKSVFR